MPRTAEIIAVGSELLTGGVTNTNARFLSELLTAAGVDVLYHTDVGDDAPRLEAAVNAARRRAELLVFTGGLGPTYDDMTKAAVCAALDTPLVFHPEVVEEIQHYFDTVFHREMPSCNLQQAYLPAGCTVFHNPVGTAPGCAFSAGGVTAVLLPGVPSECRYLAEHCLLPYLERLHGQVIRAHDLRIFGLTEPQVQELLADLLHQEEDLTLAPYAGTGEVSLHLSARAADEAACEARMAPLLAAGQLPLRRGCIRSGGGGVPSLPGKTPDPLRRRELHRRPHCQTPDGPPRCVPGLSGGCGQLHQRRKAARAGRPRLPAGGLRRRVRPRGPRHGRGRPGAHRLRPCPVRHRTGRLTLGGGRARIRTLSAHHALDLLRRYLTHQMTEGE